MAVVMTAAGGFDYTMPAGLLPFVFDMAKELLVGAVLGFYVNIMLPHSCIIHEARKNSVSPTATAFGAKDIVCS